jgi:hypothetical protein
MPTISEKLTDFQTWYARAKLGSRYCYFDGSGSGERETDGRRVDGAQALLDFARGIYDRGEGFLTQARVNGIYLYMIERCKPKTLDRVENYARRIPRKRLRRKTK